MQPQLKIGSELEKEFIVQGDCTAHHFNSGRRDILATPKLVAWMESVSQELVENFLDGLWETVGVSMHIDHEGMTPIGKKIKVKVKLIKIESKKLYFYIEALDEHNKIAQAKHERILAKSVIFERMIRQISINK